MAVAAGEGVPMVGLISLDGGKERQRGALFLHCEDTARYKPRRELLPGAKAAYTLPLDSSTPGSSKLWGFVMVARVTQAILAVLIY